MSYGKDVGVKGIEVDEQVNAGVIKRLHAAAVISIWVDVVDTNAVDAELLHELSVTLTLLSVDKGVVGTQLVGDTWGLLLVLASIPGWEATGSRRTLEEELGAVLVEEFVAEDLYGVESRNGGSHARQGEAKRGEAHRRQRCKSKNLAKQAVE